MLEDKLLTFSTFSTFSSASLESSSLEDAAIAVTCTGDGVCDDVTDVTGASLLDASVVRISDEAGEAVFGATDVEGGVDWDTLFDELFLLWFGLEVIAS